MTYSTILHAASSAVVFEPKKLIRQMRQNQSRAIAIIEIVNRLVCDGTTPIVDARSAFRREQPHQAAHMLHTLKGSINNIGGMKVVEVISDLEDCFECSQTGKQVILTLLDCLEREYQTLLCEAEKWLKLERGKLMSKEAIQAEREIEQVKQFKEHLENNNLRAFDTFEELQPFFQSSLSNEEFNGLGAFIHRLEFDKALQCIQSI